MNEYVELFLEKKIKIPKNLRFFLVLEDSYLYIYNGHVEHAKIYSIDNNWKSIPERGDLLERFAKIEFLINETIRVKIADTSYIQGMMVLDIISKQHSWDPKIEFLKKWKIIEPPIAKKLHYLAEIRNGLAHKFLMSEIRYNDEYLNTTTSWNSFRMDMKTSWNALITTYRKETERLSKQTLEIIKSL